MEYERRFLVRSLPNIEPTYVKAIRQVYWRLGNGWCLRLRRQGTDDEPDDTITIKGPRIGSERAEFEWSLLGAEPSEDQREESLYAALNLYNVGKAHSVVKTRRGYMFDEGLWDIDEFHHANEGLIIADLELKDQETLLKMQRPRWTLREITTERRYNNENLAYEPYNTWTVHQQL